MKKFMLVSLAVTAFSVESFGLSRGTSSGAGLLSLDNIAKVNPTQALDDYKKSEIGWSFITKTEKALEGYQYDEFLQPFFVGSMCGFVGCTSSFLISHTYVPHQVNSQSIGKAFLMQYDALGGNTPYAIKEVALERASGETEKADLLSAEEVIAVAEAYDTLASTVERNKKFLEDYQNGELINAEASLIQYSCGFAGCTSTYLIVKNYLTNSYPTRVFSDYAIASVPFSGAVGFLNKVVLNPEI